jgi:hypothetical protein
MTIAPLSPSPITASVRRRYFTGDGDPPPTATVSATFDRQTPIAHDKTTLPILHTATKTNAAVITQPSSVFENRKITAHTAPKSP